MRLIAATIACVLALVVSTPAAAGTVGCEELPVVLSAFSKYHYTTQRVTDEMKVRAAEQFVRSLDPSRTLLLTPEVERLKKEVPKVFETIRSGTCPMLDQALSLLISRAEEDEALAKKILGDKYVLDESVELVLDPDLRGYAKTREERAALVSKMIHFQVSNYLLASITLPAAKKQLVHRYELGTKRLKERKAAGRAAEMFAEAYAVSLDPHSSFLSADDLADFRIQMQLSLEGIGAALRSEDGFTVIESLVPGGQAEKTERLRPKDKIIAVAQEGEDAVSVIDMDLREVVKLIRGKKGTKVRLTILRDGEAASTLEVTIVRDKIDVKQQAAQISYQERTVGKRTLKIGVLDLPSFYGGGDGTGRSSYADVKALLAEAKSKKVDGIVLDLSKNGGGLLEDAVRISGLFLRKGPVVATKDTSGEVEVLEDQDADVVYAGPLVVLTSPASASAAEILAGALQVYHRAIVVGGANTFGKGTVQAVVPLPVDLGAIKVTTGMFFLPSGVSTQQKGVSADIIVPSLFDGYDFGERSLDYSLPPQSIRPFTSSAVVGEGKDRWVSISNNDLAALSAKSKARVAKNAVMAEVQKEVEEAKKNKGAVRLSDLRKRAKAEGNDHEAKEKSERMEGAFVGEGVDILADLIAGVS